ncbi:hypothetical protein JNB11_00015 [Kocuria palustris]|nr:hypothetical protein [Kocuria palustris]
MAGSSVDNSRTGDARAAESRQLGSGHRRGVENQSPPFVDAAVESFASTHYDSGDIPGNRAQQQEPAAYASAGVTTTPVKPSPAVFHATKATTGPPKESKDIPYELYGNITLVLDHLTLFNLYIAFTKFPLKEAPNSITKEILKKLTIYVTPEVCIKDGVNLIGFQTAASLPTYCNLQIDA